MLCFQHLWILISHRRSQVKNDSLQTSKDLCMKGLKMESILFKKNNSWKYSGSCCSTASCQEVDTVIAGFLCITFNHFKYLMALEEQYLEQWFQQEMLYSLVCCLHFGRCRSFYFQDWGLIRGFYVWHAHSYLRWSLTQMRPSKEESHLAPWCIACS